MTSVIIDNFVFLAGGKITKIGSFVHIGSHSSISGGGEFVMEDFSGLSGGVRAYTENEDYSGKFLTNPSVAPPYRKPARSYVRIRRHAIVGANAVILPGLEIGEGAVVGANSLVTKTASRGRSTSVPRPSLFVDVAASGCWSLKSCFAASSTNPVIVTFPHMSGELRKQPN